MPNRERVLRTYLVFLLRLANAVGDFVSRHRRKTFFLLITAKFSHNWALGSGHVFSCRLPMLLAISLEQIHCVESVGSAGNAGGAENLLCYARCAGGAGGAA